MLRDCLINNAFRSVVTYGGFSTVGWIPYFYWNNSLKFLKLFVLDINPDNINFIERLLVIIDDIDKAKNEL